MALSPQITQNGTTAAVFSGSQARGLAVRTNFSSAMEQETGLKGEKGPELAEKLNKETKNKYVKGRLNHVFNSPS